MTREEILKYLSQPFGFIAKVEVIRIAFELLTSLAEMEDRVRDLEAEAHLFVRDQAKLEQADSRVRELESDLKLNASLLAKQCDLAREAESRFSRLREAVDLIKSRIAQHDYNSMTWIGKDYSVGNLIEDLDQIGKEEGK